MVAVGTIEQKGGINALGAIPAEKEPIALMGAHDLEAELVDIPNI